ncbi:MAG TPA: Sec-independent protein translocase protein TatB [Methylotenera sp.]|nr:Sec-independent protein translocase protein TatB [Methylotenera sp.]HPV44751.1 Sec-independent protein translocase protein TatB [Methylotenera sp.]
MFDVSFSELLVIAVVALLVIGPEKLPKVARTVGAFTGRMQRYMAQIKEEVNREMRFEELQKLQQEIQQSVQSTQTGMSEQAAEIKNALAETVQAAQATPVAAIKPGKPKTAKTTTSKRVKAAAK